MKRIAIIGAGGHGKVLADIARLNGYHEIVFLDDDPNLRECGRYPVIGSSADAAGLDAEIAVGIGNAGVRMRILEGLLSQNADVAAVLIHPSAVIADDVSIGAGTVIMAGAVVNPGAVIGKGCIINTCASVDHDCRLGDYVHAAVGCRLCGAVSAGDAVWIGAGATVCGGVHLCPGVMLGAGAVAVRDIETPGTYVGVPAKRMVKV